MNNLHLNTVKPVVVFFVPELQEEERPVYKNMESTDYQCVEISSLIDLRKKTADTRYTFGAFVLDSSIDQVSIEDQVDAIDSSFKDIGAPLIAVVDKKRDNNEELYLNAGVTKIFDKNLGHDALKLAVSIEIEEFSRIRQLREELYKRTSAIGQIVEGVFRLKTRREAQNLATMLSLTCPNPMPIAIGLTELLINGVEHGCLAIGHDEKGRLIEDGLLADEIDRRRTSEKFYDRSVTLKFKRGKNCMVFEIEDGGAGFDFETYLAAERGHIKKHGRGIMMAKGCFEELVYSGNGSQVRAVHKFGY